MQDGSVTPIGSFFRNKWVRIILVIDIIVIIFIVAITINKATKTAVINFNVAPIDATITIDGSGHYENNSQAYSITPGYHEIQISHPDLDTKTFTLNLEPNSNTTITTFLSAGDIFDFYALKNNYGSFVRLASIASAEDNQTTDHDTSAEEFIANFEKAYDLYSTALPIIYSEHDDKGELTKYITIRAGNDCGVTLCLNAAMYYEDDEAIVEAMLAGAGFNLEDFEIEYQIY